MKLTDSQIAAYGVMAGFPSAVIPVVVAIALAESGGDPAASHVNSNGSVDSGLMQINSVHRSTYPIDYPLRYNPINNMRMAKGIYSAAGNSFNPWSTFKSGAYTKYMSRGAAVVGTKAGTVNQLTSTANSVDTEAAFWASQGVTLGKPLPESISNIGGTIGSGYRTVSDGTIISQEGAIYYHSVKQDHMPGTSGGDALSYVRATPGTNMVVEIHTNGDQTAGEAVQQATSGLFDLIPAGFLWVAAGSVLVLIGVLILAEGQLKP